MTTDVSHLRTRFRWVICFIIFLATAIIYMDRQILSLLFPLLEEKFKWSHTDYALLNAWYQGGYAVGLLGFGWLIDRLGIKMGYGMSLFFWGIAAACHALVVSIAGALGDAGFSAELQRATMPFLLFLTITIVAGGGLAIGVLAGAFVSRMLSSVLWRAAKP